MLPDPVGAHHDDGQTPLRTFTAALPDHVRLPTDYRVIRAVAELDRAGVDLVAVADMCGRGTERRTRNDRRRIALYRLLRAAEQLEVTP